MIVVMRLCSDAKKVSYGFRAAGIAARVRMPSEVTARKSRVFWCRLSRNFPDLDIGYAECATLFRITISTGIIVSSGTVSPSPRINA